MKIRILLSLAFVVALGFTAFQLTNTVSAGPGATQTAQSIMVNTTLGSGAYQIDGTITWTFQRGTHKEPGTAMDAYSNGTSSAPVVTCSGSATNCAVLNTPAAPAAPSADEVKLQQHAQADRCIFFNGGALNSSTYKQSSTVNGLNGRGNWTFEWTYDITPYTVVVDPHTAWTSAENGGAVDVDFSGFIAAESFMSQSGGKNKYSFTMLDGGVTRARDVSATLQVLVDGDWVEVASADLNNIDTGIDLVNDGVAVVPASGDFDYYANGGMFGSVLAALHGPTGKNANSVSDILNGVLDDGPSYRDNFVGNNNDLAAGAVGTAPFSSIFTGITQAGTYRIEVTGSVKGNGGTAAVQFVVASNLITIGGC
jgi:hypothetical protein